MLPNAVPPEPTEDPAEVPEDELEEGDFREVGGRTEFWTGSSWISAAEAVIAGYADPDSVGECADSQVAGCGAIGSAAEYSIEWRVWRVGDQWILDQQDDGMGYELFQSESDCREALEARLQELQDLKDAFGEE
jgi:hypothetical protein